HSPAACHQRASGMSLRRYSWRAIQQRPGRTILTVLSIVIGVTAVVGISLGAATTRNAYKQMFAVVTGRATLEIDALGGGGFDQAVFEKVAGIPGILAATPLVDRPTSMSYGDDKRIRMEVLGIDPERDRSVRDYEITEGRQVKPGEDEIVLDAGFAKYLELKVGDEVRLLTKRLSKPFTIVGLLETKTGAAFTQSSIGLMGIDRARYHFNPRGRSELIDKIQIVTATEIDPEVVAAQISPLLPDGVQVHQPAARTQLMSETLRSGESGLRTTTLFAFLLAAFIILNTFLMNVSERRRHISIMRAIGATRQQMTRSIIEEGLWFGVIGTVIGMGLGVAMAYVATYVLSVTFQVQLPRIAEVMTPWPFISGAVFGLLMAFLGSAVPAWLAGRVSPLEGMNRIVRGKTRSFTLTLLIGGAMLTLGSLGVIFTCIYGYLPIEVAQFFAVPFLIGVVMLDSVVLAPQAAFVAWWLRLFARVEATLSLKQVLRHHLRTVLTVGMLFIAGSTGVGMANSILDNIRDIYDWYDQAIQGDFFVRAMMPDMERGDAADLPYALGDELKAIPDIRLSSAAFVEARIHPSGAKDDEPLNAIAIARTLTDAQPAFDLVEGDSSTLRDKLLHGEVVISTVIAQKLKAQVGDTIALETKEGIQRIPICGIANEYMVGGMAVHMSFESGQKWLDIEGVDGYVIRCKDEHQAAALRPQLAEICKKYDVFLLSRADIRQNVAGFVNGVEWLLWVLVMMLFVVAAIGVVNTLTMNVLEQTRELGLLRIVAMTKRQVRRTILMQAVIIGCISLPSGVAMGLAVAYVLNMAMPASIGRPIDFNFYPLLLFLTLGGAFVIVLVAAYFPARRATRINVVEALHYE
ncbi:MAG TPA: FtsX-like permease family protein, partial [Pirellulaceae bacterium]|nr:FtsX-like permease family protein [Pirellulaceae bacterium]